MSIRVKEMVVVTLLTLLVVGTTTLIHLSHLSRVVAQESQRQAELIARQIYAQSRAAIAAAPAADALDALRNDRELRNLLESSVGYSPISCTRSSPTARGGSCCTPRATSRGGLRPRIRAWPRSSPSIP